MNGGNCQELVNGFSCVCAMGYEGSLCEVEIDECSSNPCLQVSGRRGQVSGNSEWIQLYLCHGV